MAQIAGWARERADVVGLPDHGLRSSGPVGDDHAGKDQRPTNGDAGFNLLAEENDTAAEATATVDVEVDRDPAELAGLRF